MNVIDTLVEAHRERVRNGLPSPSVITCGKGLYEELQSQGLIEFDANGPHLKGHDEIIIVGGEE